MSEANDPRICEDVPIRSTASDDVELDSPLQQNQGNIEDINVNTCARAISSSQVNDAEGSQLEKYIFRKEDLNTIAEKCHGEITKLLTDGFFYYKVSQLEKRLKNLEECATSLTEVASKMKETQSQIFHEYNYQPEP